ncbi:hypothetical protein F5883DRAFT_359036, partial [Diaporthe sp. PMI_573]
RAQPASRSVSWADIAATTPPPTSSWGTRVSTRSGAPSGNKTSVTSATPKPPKEDLRVLIALDTDEGRGGTPRREPFEVRSLICKEFNLRLADVPDVRPTPTGYAVRTASPAVRDGLLSPEPLQKLQSLLGAARVGRPEKWFNYAVPEVPWT